MLATYGTIQDSTTGPESERRNLESSVIRDAAIRVWVSFSPWFLWKDIMLLKSDNELLALYNVI